jgi:probable phosphoglycerate mutase
LGHKDIPLNDRGQQEAAEAGVCLKWLDTSLLDTEFVSGPLGRTRETMEIVRRAAGLDPMSYRVDARLTEVDFGEWEGRTWEEVRQTDPARYDLRAADPWDYVMPGGESYAMAADRVHAALQALTRNAVIVSHGGVCRAVLTLLAGVDARTAPTLAIPQDKVLVIRDGAFAWFGATTDLKVW